MAFEASYGLILRVKHKDVLTLFKKENTSLKNSSGFTDFTMTFANYKISNDGIYVDFPFLGKFSLQVRSLTAMEKGGDYDGVNTTMELEFEVPSAIMTDERSLLKRKKEWDVIPMLIMASKITNKPDTSFEIFYVDRPEERLIISDLVAIDFKAKDDFNPLKNMSFEGLSFTRRFAGVTKVMKKILETKSLNKKESKPIKKDKSKDKKKKCLQEASKIKVSEVMDAMININKLTSTRSIRLSATDDEISVGGNVYKATLNPNGVDFKNLYLISDIASDSGGVLQLSSIFNRSSEVQTMDYTKKGLSKLLYDNPKSEKDPEKNTTIKENKPKVEDDRVLVDRFINNALKKLGEEDIISSRAMNLSRAFNVNIAMDRAILGLNLFDKIEVSSSLLGIYDGTWLVTQVEYEYDNGKLSQTIKALPDILSKISKNAQVKKYLNNLKSKNK